jgi:hypothetical protein
MQECYRLFALFATADCVAVSGGRRLRSASRVLCGLLAATLAAVFYGLSIGPSAARAGTPQNKKIVVTIPTAPAGGSQQAGTEQSAGADTSATQQQPTNIAISIRIDSPGNDGPINQTNVVIGGATGANDASTSQGGGNGGQNASTDQQAGATTNVSQDAAGNLVVVIRINSPGRNGPISQTNAAAGSSNASNTSATSQGATAPTTPSTLNDNAAGSRLPRRAPRLPARKAAAAPRPRAPGPVATASAARAPVASGPAEHASDAAAARSTHHPRHALQAPAATHKASADNSVKAASPLGNALADAGNLLGNVAPAAPIGGSRQSADVSHSILLSLLAALSLAAAFAAWSQRSLWLGDKRLGKRLLR